jgi:hypothetical protein
VTTTTTTDNRDPHGDQGLAHEPHVHSVEWTSSERVFGIDGREQRREQLHVPLPRRHVVRSTLTDDYEAVEVVEPIDEPSQAEPAPSRPIGRIGTTRTET